MPRSSSLKMLDILNCGKEGMPLNGLLIFNFKFQINFLFKSCIFEIYEILKFTHTKKRQKHLTFCLNFHSDVYDMFLVQPVSNVLSSTYMYIFCMT